MFETTTEIDGNPAIEAGTSAANSIEIRLDQAQSLGEIASTLTNTFPYKTTITLFDRMGRLKCRRVGEEHFDQAPIPVTVNRAMVDQLANTVPLTIGISLLLSVEAAVRASIASVKATSVTTSATLGGPAGAIASAVRAQLAQSIGLTKTLAVTYHADECFERNNPYGLCLEITVSGRLTFRQDSTIARGSDGLFHHKLRNSGEITAVTIGDIDASVDPCVMPDDSPARIPGCERLRKVGSRMPVETIDGVGTELGGKLREKGIATVGDLAKLDIDADFEGIPRNLLLAARAKARMLAGMTADAANWASLGDRSVKEVLAAPPKALRDRTGGTVDDEAAMRVKEDLATLLVSLDDSVVRDATLSELSGKLDLATR